MADAIPARKRLSRFMEERALDLDMDWRALAAKAGISYETIRSIRAGTTDWMRPRTMRKLDNALQWKPGSVQAVLDGGDPEPLGDDRPRDLRYADPELDRLAASIWAIPDADEALRRGMIVFAAGVRTTARDEQHREAG